jgi:hypothetical protein
VNSGLWFVQGIRHPWNHLAWLTEIWGVLLLAQLVSVVVQRPKADAESTSAGPS